MSETETLYNDVVAAIPQLTNVELDLRLESAAVASEKAEMLICCYLVAVRERGLYREFGYSSVVDYARARFGFEDRKTRYLIALGRKIDELPKIRAALASGKLGWCKASRVASVANRENEVMWLESALSLTVQQLARRIKDGTDTLASTLHLPLTEDRRVMWENALEIYRRRAGSEISPVEAFELMIAEVIAEWGWAPGDDESEAGPLEATDTTKDAQPSLFESELEAEAAFENNPDYEAMRQFVLERDSWQCTYPGCGARAQLHVHHIRYRSHGICHEPWNLTVVCNFHHDLIHKKHVGLKGRAPAALEWTPPKLMQDVFDRRRNRPSIWLGELDVREWTLESPAAPT